MIPETDLLWMIKEVAKSVTKLAPLTDYFCKLRNANELVELACAGQDWENFRSQWVQTCAWVPDKRRKIKHSEQSEGSTLDQPYTQAESKAMKDAVIAALNTVALRRDVTLDFSLLLSTEQNYRTDNMTFYGPYMRLRAKLDYTYHSNYTRTRQCLQDAIIEKLLQTVKIVDVNGDECTTPTEPWIVFTAGAMGAGKSYTVRNLVEKKRFPILGFVSVDPDEVRRHLPEFLMYATLAPEKAGDLTNKECGYVAEILTLAALETGKNVLVDGSLRDSDWYHSYFAQLRQDYPKLRIGILHITAPLEAVLERAAVRIG